MASSVPSLESCHLGFAVRRMTNLEEIREADEYHVLDMLRWPSHLYDAAYKICEHLTREVGAFHGQVGSERRSERQEAVAEVLLHYQNYVKRVEGDGYEKEEMELITREDEHAMEATVGVTGRFDRRFRKCRSCRCVCCRTSWGAAVWTCGTSRAACRARTCSTCWRGSRARPSTWARRWWRA